MALCMVGQCPASELYTQLKSKCFLEILIYFFKISVVLLDLELDAVLHARKVLYYWASLSAQVFKQSIYASYTNEKFVPR